MQSKKINELGTNVSPSIYDLTVVGDAATGQLKKITLNQIASLFGSVGGVSSVAMTVPTGLTVTGSPITTSGTLAVTLTAGYSIPTTAKQSEWDTGYADRLKWDGGASGLNAATARTSLGLVIGTDVLAYRTFGSAANNNTGDFATAAQGTNADTAFNLRLTGASVPLSISGNIISIAQSSTSISGFLSSTDWNTFNGKQQALNGTGFVKASGTSITYDNSTYLTTSSAASTYLTISSASSTYLSLAGGTLTGALNGTSATFSSDVELNGASGTRTLTIQNNTSGNAVLSLVAAGSDSGSITYNRATSQLVFANSSASNAMVITNSGNVAIGTTSTSTKLNIVDSSFNQYSLRVESATGNTANRYGGIGLAGESANTKAAILFVSDGSSFSRGSIVFSNNNASDQTNADLSTERVRINSSGNLLVNTTTDLGAGYKLQVNGSISMAYANFFNFKGSSDAGDVIIDNSGSSLRVTGLAKFDSTVTFTTTTFFEGLLTNYNVYNTQTSSYTLVLADASKIVEMNVASANTVTIPTNASVAFPIGTEITVLQYGAGVTSIAVASGVTIVSKDNANIIANRYSGVTLIKRATNEWYLIGNIIV